MLLVHVPALGAVDYALPLILAILAVPQIMERSEKRLRVSRFIWIQLGGFLIFVSSRSNRIDVHR
jgi:cytochrome c biogenesis protein CcdA